MSEYRFALLVLIQFFCLLLSSFLLLAVICPPLLAAQHAQHPIELYPFLFICFSFLFCDTVSTPQFSALPGHLLFRKVCEFIPFISTVFSICYKFFQALTFRHHCKFFLTLIFRHHYKFFLALIFQASLTVIPLYK